MILRCDDAPMQTIDRISFFEFDASYILLEGQQVLEGEDLGETIGLTSITAQTGAASLPQYWETYISGRDENGNQVQAMWAVRLNLFECDYQPWGAESIGIMRLVRKRTFLENHKSHMLADLHNSTLGRTLLCRCRGSNLCPNSGTYHTCSGDTEPYSGAATLLFLPTQSVYLAARLYQDMRRQLGLDGRSRALSLSRRRLGVVDSSDLL